ncbi:AbrB/MazE/SpoVT family DNA-binding domain-containing protein [uncultured Sphingomonas sp.]|uniref:AbrB/MazE/SpoVT family DNA-binding domain-containing protein n=1 Tax=uncultured Sphingomonas sp. TaxID=158754 RepID=UPI00258C6221|nr:AbrB/MazE/SpoVT family DNA-binding domain-containing protein [uncultured Sphingomonas sp.]
MNAPLDKRTRTNMTSKGQVLIPKDVRDLIGLVPGQPVEVGINDRGEAVVVPQGAASETPEQRRRRLLSVLAEMRRDPLFDRPSAEIMRELRGDDPLP